MTEKPIEYVPITKLSRGYAGQMIDNMEKNDSVVYIMKNNKPLAVIISVEDYNAMLRNGVTDRLKHLEACGKIAGRLHSYSDESRIEGERDYYRKAVSEQ